MNTLIIYASQHGCTETCANKLKDMLADQTDLVNIKTSKGTDLASYDTILVGGSIHAGRLQGKIRKFCQKNEALLLTKKLGLFLCHMEQGENAQKQFDNNYPESLRQHASAKGLFGGAFDFEKMKGIEKAIIKKIAKIEKSVSKVSEKAIEDFAAELQASGS